jgi:hypothetical protein
MTVKPKRKKQLGLLGWREWISLPELGIEKIKAKIDTGARTSALHAFAIETFQEGDQKKIRFDMHPFQKDTQTIISCIADVIDKRWVSDSGGHREERYVIRTPIIIGDQSWPIEITLTERDTMLFRMLLGRSAIKRHFVVNPGLSFLTTKHKVPL